MGKIVIGKKDIALFGFQIYLCCIYLGNIAKVIGIVIFTLLSFSYLWGKKLGQYTKMLIVFTLYLCLSYIWANKRSMNTTVAALEVIISFSMVYCSWYIYAYVNNENDIKNLIKTIIISLYFLIIYLFMNTPISQWGTFYLGRNIGVHKNEIGMNLAWGSVLAFYYISRGNKNRVFYTITFLFFAGISLISGSRIGVVIMVGCIGAYLILSEHNSRLLRNIGISILLGLAILYSLYNIPVLYNLLGQRMEIMIKTIFRSSSVSQGQDYSIWERSYFRNYALKMYTERGENIIFGHGLDGFRTRMIENGYKEGGYSHCNYTEMLVNYGIIGFLLYYIFKIRMLAAYIRGKRKKISSLFMCVLIIFLICDYGVISYYNEIFQIMLILSYCVLVKIPDINGRKLMKIKGY